MMTRILKTIITRKKRQTESQTFDLSIHFHLEHPIVDDFEGQHVWGIHSDNKAKQSRSYLVNSSHRLGASVTIFPETPRGGSLRQRHRISRYCSSPPGRLGSSMHCMLAAGWCASLKDYLGICLGT